jgi:hypothetical protein
MARDEQQSQEIIANLIIEYRIEIRHAHLLRAQLTAKLLVLASDACPPAEVVDGTILRSRHKPSARILRNLLRPLLEGGHEYVLREVLGESYIIHDPHQSGDEPG